MRPKTIHEISSIAQSYYTQNYADLSSRKVYKSLPIAKPLGNSRRPHQSESSNPSRSAIGNTTGIRKKHVLRIKPSLWKKSIRSDITRKKSRRRLIQRPIRSRLFPRSQHVSRKAMPAVYQEASGRWIHPTPTPMRSAYSNQVPRPVPNKI